MKKSYYAIIPATVRYDKALTNGARLLYGEITALCHQEGYCWATNSYFANLYEVSNTTISSWISQLEKQGHITRWIKYKEGTKEIEGRYLSILNGGMQENLNTPIQENLKDNTTSFNNTFNNTSNKDIVGKPDIPYKEIVDYLNEVTGKQYRSSTKKTKELIKARWNDKFRLEDFKKVIDIKYEEWKNDNKMKNYIRPNTLFGTKFDDYLNQEQPKQTGYDPNKDAF